MDIWRIDHASEAPFFPDALGNDGWTLAWLVGCRDVEISVRDLQAILPSALREAPGQAKKLTASFLKKMSRLGLATATRKGGKPVYAYIRWSRLIADPDRYLTHHHRDWLGEWDEVLTKNGFPDTPLGVRLAPEFDGLRREEGMVRIYQKMFPGLGS